MVAAEVIVVVGCDGDVVVLVVLAVAAAAPVPVAVPVVEHVTLGSSAPTASALRYRPVQAQQCSGLLLLLRRSSR